VSNKTKGDPKSATVTYVSFDNIRFVEFLWNGINIMSRSDCGIFLHISTIFPVINKCENLFSTNHQITFLIKREDVFTHDLPSQKSCLIICISYCLIFRFLYNWNIVSCNTIWDPHTTEKTPNSSQTSYLLLSLYYGTCYWHSGLLSVEFVQFEVFDKYTVVSVTQKRKTISHTYQLHGHTLEKADSAKYLGITFQNNLKWDKHINK
jgi:hypothetical protein